MDDSARIQGGPQPGAPPGSLRARLARHEALLWWLHSAYVLALGAGVMSLGARNYSWLRYSALYLSAIWALSFFLANVVQHRTGARWRREGFRLWSTIDVARVSGARVLRLYVVTAGGQLVGRAELRASR